MQIAQAVAQTAMAALSAYASAAAVPIVGTVLAPIAAGAAHIFRSMAETILPYTPGSTFTVENAYKMNGIAPENTPKQTTSDTSAQSDDILSDIRGRAQNLVDEAGKAISDAKIKEKAQTVWDTIVDLFH